MSETPPAEDRSEEALVIWLQRRVDSEIGDDCALLDWQGPLAVTTDTQQVGVHLPAEIDVAVAARRLLAVNLSDLAAVGAEPKLAVLALGAPPTFDRRRFLRALATAAERHGARLVGGDLSRAPALSATLTLLGTRSTDRRWLRRSAARPGDRIWVGGSLGESATGLALVRRGARLVRNRVLLPPELGLSKSLERAARRAVRRHLAPKPQLELGHWLSAQPYPIAAIDVSDGLGKDLTRLCRASDVGARVDRVAISVAQAALCLHLGVNAVELALGGGEDYVLLFTLPSRTEPPARFGCRQLGEITREHAVSLTEPGSEPRDISSAGFDHLTAGRAASS